MKRRMRQIFGSDGRMLMVAMDHTAFLNEPVDGLVNYGGTIKAAVAAGTAPGNDIVPQAKFGAVAFDIGVNGTIDAIEAPANATGYASALLAAAALPAPAADHARMGYVTATKSDGTFTFGTTALNAANSTVAYTDYLTVFNAATTVTPASPAIPEYLSA